MIEKKRSKMNNKCSITGQQNEFSGKGRWWWPSQVHVAIYRPEKTSPGVRVPGRLGRQQKSMGLTDPPPPPDAEGFPQGYSVPHCVSEGADKECVSIWCWGGRFPRPACELLVEEFIYKVLKVMEGIGGGDTMEEDFIWRRKVFVEHLLKTTTTKNWW